MSTKGAPVPDLELLKSLRFDAARDADSAAKARVLSRLGTTIAGGGAANSPSPGPRESAPYQPRPTPSADLRVGRTTRLRMGSFVARPGVLAAAAFVAGGVGGAGLYATLTAPRERIVYLDRPVAVPEPRPFVMSVPGLRAEVHEGSRANAPKESPAASNVAGSTDLASERALLDRARDALAQGSAADAERMLATHARRFPAGLLAEEREALAVKTLVDLGRVDEARRRASRFKERFPASIFGPAVDETMGAIR